MFSTRPPPCLRKWGSAAWIRRKGALKSTATVRSNISASVFSILPRTMAAALFTRPSILPKRATVSAISREGTAGSSRAPMVKKVCSPSSATSAWAASFRLPWIITLRALANEGPRHSLPDSGSRPGHQDHFVFQSHTHGRSTPLTMTPECISSNASCHSLSGEMRLRIGSRSILPVASSEMTFSQIGQL